MQWRFVKENGPGLLIFIAVFGYIMFRAICVPLFSDEVSTFFRYVQTGGIDPFSMDANANNHVLNSLLMRISYLCFGDSPLALRLPNVLSFLIYAFFVFRFQKMFPGKWLGLCWVLVMFGSHYLISFFHLARGYGISIAFLLAALYYLFVLGREFSNRSLIAGCLSMALAVWANLSLLICGIAFLGWMFLLLIQRYRQTKETRKWITGLALFGVFGVVPLVFGGKLALYLKEGGALYHGVDSGFIQVVVNLFMQEVVPEHPSRAAWFFWPFFVVYLAATCYQVYLRQFNPEELVLQGVFWLTIAGTIAAHLLLDVYYPLDRAALHFFPLFVTVFFLSLRNIPRKFSIVAGAVPAILLSFQQLSFANLNRTAHWANEHSPHSLHDRLLHWQDSTGIYPLISVHGLSGRSLVYNSFQAGGRLNTPYFEQWPAPSADFVIYNNWESFDDPNFILLENYGALRINLFERNTHTDWVDSVRHLRGPFSEGRESAELGEFEVDGRVNQAAAVEFSGLFHSEDELFRGWLALRLSDSLDRELKFYYIDLARVAPRLSPARTITRRLLIDDLPAEKVKISVSMMNIGGNLYSLRDASVVLSVRRR